MNPTYNKTDNDHSTISNNTALHEDDLTSEAKQYFGYHTDVLHVFESYRQSVLRNEFVTPTGQSFFLSVFHNCHTNFKRVLNYAVEHNKFLDQSLPTLGPLVICSLPRTGTTLLYNLLACDPNCRAPLYTDMCIEVVPPIARSDLTGQKRRIDIANSSQQGDGKYSDLLNRISASHAYFPIEGDHEILRQAGYFPFFNILSDDEGSSAERWIRNEMNKDYVYDYHETFLRMMNTVDMPKSHWLLKSSFHCFRFDKFLQHYPDALLIMNHRHIEEVLPSLCSLSMAIFKHYFNESDSVTRGRIIRRNCQYIDKAVECIMKFRTSQNGALGQTKRRIFDVKYEDLKKNPIGVVHQIYDYFNLALSPEMETSMQNWLLENPQGKQGCHAYSLAQFGLNRENLEAHYADYTDFFLPSTSSDH